MSLVTPAAAQGAGRGGVDWRILVAEASRRFEIPERWIHAVMGVESAYQPSALSPAGAMGLMQVMPGTYADLRVRYGLGADPYQPRDNVMAGAAYLREMYDRFGAPGFLAAYNAGPAWYLQHVTDGRPLPLATRAYVAKLSPSVTGDAIGSVLAPAPEAPRPTIFVSLGASVRNPSTEPSGIANSPSTAGDSGLFVRLGEGRRAP
ncbi:lytic transglycosylase domain-containing protein [Phenylobacterium sp.]|uniref:lytic transglycosylase domain-containing protein n=1 Tax=Phenylobacterium sp. TaxID=1871053 RepID=UPI0025D37140|nr:lytic transglycosylase domain-containing protein [Phenylobacterium sp.]